jgi:hypothetical protein
VICTLKEFLKVRENLTFCMTKITSLFILFYYIYKN